MERIITTVEMRTEIKKWLEWYSHENDMTFSEAMNHHIDLTRQMNEHKIDTMALSLHQKLLLQSSIECLLFLKELLNDERMHHSISEKAKTLIRNTLNEQKPLCPPS